MGPKTKVLSLLRIASDGDDTPSLKGGLKLRHAVHQGGVQRHLWEAERRHVRGAPKLTSKTQKELMLDSIEKVWVQIKSSRRG